MFKEHGVCQMLTLTLFKIFPSKYIWATTLHFRVTWRYLSHDLMIHQVPFPVGASLYPSLYLKPFSR